MDQRLNASQGLVLSRFSPERVHVKDGFIIDSLLEATYPFVLEHRADIGEECRIPYEVFMDEKRFHGVARGRVVAFGIPHYGIKTKLDMDNNNLM